MSNNIKMSNNAKWRAAILRRFKEPDCPICGNEYGLSLPKIVIVDVTIEGENGLYAYPTTLCCQKCLSVWKTVQEPDGENPHLLIPSGPISEHRWVWQHFNGPISSDDIIHHLNGIHNDNRIENLTCIPRKAHNTGVFLSHKDMLLQAQRDRIIELESQLSRR